jgi:hypothetical protein
MSITWTTPAGNLGTIQERSKQDIVLNVSSSTQDLTLSLQAGSLPAGLRIEGTAIRGTPLEVRNTKTSKFVIRAEDSEEKKDRTFFITIEGADSPLWVTPEGLLPVGPNSTFFVLDNDKVDFRLEALDPDTPAGDELEYYIPFNGGELPPGLTLSSEGRISGFTDPIFAVEYSLYSGNFDEQLFDSAPYDLGIRPTNGYDSFTFDEQTFDYFDAVKFPRRLSRYYQFIVVVSDGLNEERRSFQIYVVNEEFLRADNTIMQVGTGIFRADNTYIRNPIWITEPDLGFKRANNYVTIYLEVFDPPSLPGTISYRFETVNPEISAVVSDRAFDQDDFINIEVTPVRPGVFGVPRRNQKIAIAEVYNFIDSTLGTYTITSVEETGTNRYRLGVDPMLSSRIKEDSELIIGTPSELPPGLEIDTITGELVGRIPYQPRITKNYSFTITATAFNLDYEARASTPRTFNIKILGEIESGIKWVSPALLGTVSPNKNSMLAIEAISNLRGGLVLFELESGTLPPGLSLLPSGEIIGKVNQIGNESKQGLTRFYECSSRNSITQVCQPGSMKDFSYIYDGDSTSFDKKYTVVVKAKDIFNYAETSKTFQIEVVSEADKVFSNLFVKAFQKKSKRETWYSFISDGSIFEPERIYRYGDPAFGVQQEVKMLVYAGIESVEAEKFVQAMSRNHYRKQFRFGDVKKAVAKNTNTQEVIYEVVYIDIIDNLEKNNVSISKTVNLPDSINSRILISGNNITVDADSFLISDRDYQRIFPNSIKNMRKQIKDITVSEDGSTIRNAERDRTYLPLWMRSIQQDSFVEPGFVSAMPLCYARPGEADRIMLNIKNSGFDFKILDFEVDRYLIDSIGGVLEDKYLAFPQRGEKR